MEVPSTAQVICSDSASLPPAQRREKAIGWSLVAEVLPAVASVTGECSLSSMCYHHMLCVHMCGSFRVGAGVLKPLCVCWKRALIKRDQKCMAYARFLTCFLACKETDRAQTHIAHSAGLAALRSCGASEELALLA
jgi:hypothetical protein